MNLPPVTQEYEVSSQVVLNEELVKADTQNLKLDRDNFLESGSISLKDSDGYWWTISINTSGVLQTTKLVGDQLDANGRPLLASTNPYYVAP